MKKKLLAIDFGNKQVKFKTENSNGAQVMPSLLLKQSDVGDRFIHQKSEDEPSLFRLPKEEAYYFGGKMTTFAGGNHLGKAIESIGFGEKRYRSDSFKHMVLFSIAHALKVSDYNHVVIDIQSGVPTKDYREETVDIIRRFLVGKHTVYIDDQPIHFDVNEIRFIQQFLGTVLDQALILEDGDVFVDERFGEMDYGVVDIGGGTVLINRSYGFNLESGTESEELREGTFRFLSGVASRANIKPAIADHLFRHPLINPDGSKRYRLNAGRLGEKDITDYVVEEQQLFTQNIFKLVETEIFARKSGGSGLETQLNRLFLTGGGVNVLDQKLFMKLVEESYIIPDSIRSNPQALVFVHHPAVANVNGYYLNGISIGLGEFGKE